METKSKLIVCIGRNGSRISIKPEAIVCAQPDENIIGETVVVVAIGASQGQLFVKCPHDHFTKLWQSALNGQELLN